MALCVTREMTVTDDELQRSIDEARAIVLAEQKLRALERLRRSVVAERRLLRILTIMAIAVGVFGAAEGLVARSALDDYRDGQHEARVNACEQFNDQQQRSVEGNKAQVREVFASLTSDEPLTPARKARLDRLFADHDRVIEEAFPMRDCSDEGIDAYVDDDPATDPFVYKES